MGKTCVWENQQYNINYPGNLGIKIYFLTLSFLAPFHALCPQHTVGQEDKKIQEDSQLLIIYSTIMKSENCHHIRYLCSE